MRYFVLITVFCLLIAAQTVLAGPNKLEMIQTLEQLAGLAPGAMWQTHFQGKQIQVVFKRVEPLKGHEYAIIVDVQ